MGKTPGYFIVEAGALPEIFLKVAEAKRLLETGEAETVHQAAQQVGISRSAFYKYKDAVRPFNDMLGRTGGIVRRPEYLCPDGRKYSHHQPVHPGQRLRGGDGGGGDLRPVPAGGGADGAGPADGGRAAL